MAQASHPAEHGANLAIVLHVILGAQASVLIKELGDRGDDGGRTGVEDFRLDRADAMEKMLAPYPGLFLTGSAYRGVGVPDCIYQGAQTAEGMLASLSHPLRRETYHRPDCA
jgi:hypothetical protein